MLRIAIARLNKHPYSVDLKILSEQKKRETKHSRLSVSTVFGRCSRKAWEKTKSLYGFFVPEGYKGGAGR
ncbi:unnamed protein product [Phytomonas sp. EM1]|nr:unnamed protein product [Phytomonas sp. EM1]|eukprot:CCW63549.1 unnamed protein product [Phytomonas sp. isolate EM1]